MGGFLNRRISKHHECSGGGKQSGSVAEFACVINDAWEILRMFLLCQVL